MLGAAFYSRCKVLPQLIPQDSSTLEANIISKVIFLLRESDCKEDRRNLKFLCENIIRRIHSPLLKPLPSVLVHEEPVRGCEVVVRTPSRNGDNKFPGTTTLVAGRSFRRGVKPGLLPRSLIPRQIHQSRSGNKIETILNSPGALPPHPPEWQCSHRT